MNKTKINRIELLNFSTTSCSFLLSFFCVELIKIESAFNWETYAITTIAKRIFLSEKNKTKHNRNSIKAMDEVLLFTMHNSDSIGFVAPQLINSRNRQRKSYCDVQSKVLNPKFINGGGGEQKNVNN